MYKPASWPIFSLKYLQSRWRAYSCTMSVQNVENSQIMRVTHRFRRNTYELIQFVLKMDTVCLVCIYVEPMRTTVQSWTSDTRPTLTTREHRCGEWPGTSRGQSSPHRETMAVCDSGKVTKVLSIAHRLNKNSSCMQFNPSNKDTLI